MATALLPAEPTQTPQRGGARFFRRIGGAVRGALAGGIALVGGRRRPAELKPSRKPPSPRDPAAAPTPKRPRQPRTAAPAQSSSRPGWFARWFGPRPQPETASPAQAEAASPAAPADPVRRAKRRKDILFTPETHPGLTAEDCAFLNTPLKDCDPEKLQPLLEALSQGIAAVMGPGLGMDADALFATFCDRMFLTPGQAATAGPVPAEEPAPPADAPQDAAPEAPPAAPGAPLPTNAEQCAAPDYPAAPAKAALTLSRRPAPRGRFHHRRRRLARQRCSPPRRVASSALRASPPTRRLCYAACAGPP